MIDYESPDFWWDLYEVLLKGTAETLYVVALSLLFATLIGLPMGIVLVGTERGGFLRSGAGSDGVAQTVNTVLGFVVNLGRSVPFIILMIALIPFTRLLVGTFIGPTASIVPLTVVAAPFFARMVEIAVKEVDPGLYETADSLGATRWLLVRRIILPETLPSIVLGLSTTATSIINFSAMAGVVGGGGLGNVAITYGHQRYSWIHMLAVIIILFVIVQLIQGAATLIARRLDRRETRSSSPRRAPGVRTSFDAGRTRSRIRTTAPKPQ